MIRSSFVNTSLKRSLQNKVIFDLSTHLFMRRSIFVLLCSIIYWFVQTSMFSEEAHPLKLSVCEINHDKASECLVMEFRFFKDDFNTALEKQCQFNYHLDEENAVITLDARQCIDSYIREHFKMAVNQQDLSIVYKSEEIDQEVIRIRYTTDKLKGNISYMSIYNTTMMSLFDEQCNLVRYNPGDNNMYTFRLTKNEPKAEKKI